DNLNQAVKPDKCHKDPERIETDPSEQFSGPFVT
ncbi:hypothetical protein SAMN05216278_3386, partial [Halopelagius longus]